MLNGEKWHYFAIKRLSALVRGLNSKHHVDFYCRNCVHSFTTENQFEPHNKACQNQDF